MKREGRQHGMVRTYRVLPSPWNPRPEPRSVQQFESPPTAGLFTKVPMKPTNHSKFTGQCGRARCLECHVHPACKSKDKAKGTQKFRSNDMTTNYKMVTWRIVDERPGLNLSGFSAEKILDHLTTDYEDCYDDYDDHAYDDGDDQRFKVINSQSGEEVENYERKFDDDDEKYEGVDDVKFVLDQESEEEGWCLVGEI